MAGHWPGDYYPADQLARSFYDSDSSQTSYGLEPGLICRFAPAQRMIDKDAQGHNTRYRFGKANAEALGQRRGDGMGGRVDPFRLR